MLLLLLFYVAFVVAAAIDEAFVDVVASHVAVVFAAAIDVTTSAGLIDNFWGDYTPAMLLF